ncbi:MAG: GIY-YIG nuclease family protein [Pyrinomonadaceae bacterium]
MSCELSNWSGKAYKIPRIKIKECGDRDDLKGTGVYLLLGKTDDGRDLVYIGEAEAILKRLNQQLVQKEFWNEAIAFISKDENLNKAHIKYLENRLHDIAGTVNRYKVDNTVVPTQSSISESDRAEMEEFIQNIRMLVNTLGHKVFDEKREFYQQKQQDHLYIQAVRGADGQGRQTSEGFVVFKGAKAAATTVNSLTPNFIAMRQKLIEDGILIFRDDHYEFSDDFVFSSPSTAAVIVMGRNANGLTEWKNKEGRTLKDLESKVKVQEY